MRRPPPPSFLTPLSVIPAPPLRHSCAGRNPPTPTLTSTPIHPSPLLADLRTTPEFRCASITRPDRDDRPTSPNQGVTRRSAFRGEVRWGVQGRKPPHQPRHTPGRPRHTSVTPALSVVPAPLLPSVIPMPPPSHLQPSPVIPAPQPRHSCAGRNPPTPTLTSPQFIPPPF